MNGHLLFRLFEKRVWLLEWILLAAALQPPAVFGANFYPGVATNNLPWPGGVVPYLFDTNVTEAEQEVYLDGMREWELAANVHFVPYTNQSQYVILRFDYQQGTNTYVASDPPVMTIDTLSRGQICHETGHLLGFQHEQVRTDRDSYLIVHFDNLQTNGLGEQDAGITSLYLIDSNSTAYGSYDFESVMHYGRTLFSIDPDTLDVLVPQPPYYLKYYHRIGNLALSVGDRAGAAYLYGPPTTPLTNVVTTTADVGFGSLRAAIYYANDHPGTTIRFDIPASDPGYRNGVYTIELTGELPPLVADGTIIDATTERGFLNRPVVSLSGARLIPEIAYTNSFYASGLHLYAANGEIRGLAINHFPDTGIYIQYAFALSNRVDGCYIGLDPQGTNADGMALEGIQITDGASYNFVGGTNAGQRNVISGNGEYGIIITGSNTAANTVLGNYIGLNAAGTGAVSNKFSGVAVWGGSSSSVIGGAVAGAGNIISGNGFTGVFISDTATLGTVLQGNYVGTDAAGDTALPNADGGIVVGNGAQGVTIGGTDAAARNILSGNGSAGLWLGDGGGSNVVQGNWIGLNAAGTGAVSNGWVGIYIVGGSGGNLVGGAVPGAANVISGNYSEGLYLSDPGTANNVVQGNFIGTGPEGTNAIPNGYTGIGIWNGAADNLIGGTTAAARNFISGNAGQGIAMGDPGTSGNAILGNYVGVDITGTNALPNGGIGLYLVTGASSNTIGGTVVGAGNLISASGGDGIQLFKASSNVIQGNLVGTDRTGLVPLGSGASALSLIGGSAFNTVGGTTAAARNLLSASTNYDGIFISDSGTSNNVIQGNYIGTDITGTQALPNGGVGVVIGDGAQNNFLGGTVPGAGNLVSANVSDGIQMYGEGTISNTVQGNFVGTSADGSSPLGNGDSALAIFSGPQFNTIGGATAAARNIFAASTNFDGVYLYAASNNIVQGNYIGTDIGGVLPFTNGAEGVALFGGSVSNQIGGAAPGAGNVIAASVNRGIFIADPGTSNNFVQGNNIGLGADGSTALGNGFEGVAIANGASGNVIGLTIDGSGAGNRIAFNTFAGIYVGYYNETDTQGNTIRGNSIFANGFLGIELAGGIENSDGVTANDAGDGDGGPNDLQNYPVIATVTAQSGSTVIAGSLNSTPGHGFLIDVYRSTDADPSGFGEGRVYVGSQTLNTDGSGDGSFEITTSGNFSGQHFTATATDTGTGDTSEFSAAVTATNAPPPPEFAGLLVLDANGFTFNVGALTNRTYRIQATSELFTNPIPWVDLTNFAPSDSVFQFTDPDATNYAARYYRVVSP